MVFPQIPHSRKQYLQFGLVFLCLLCIVPTRLVWKNQKWRFPSLVVIGNKKSSSTSTTPTAINTTAECRYFPEALFQFTNALHDRPEQTALKDWTLSNKGHRNYPPWRFPGLSGPLLEKTLRGKKMVLVGDSTLFYMMRWMQTLLVNTSQATLDHLVHMDMTAGNYAVNPEYEDQVGWDDPTPAEVELVTTTNNGEPESTHILWLGHRGATNEASCQFDDIWRQIRQMRPNIMVVNFGLHWLHLIANRGRSVPLCAVHNWLAYEQEWLEQVTQVATEANVKLLLFKTTNFMCTDNFWGEYSDAVAGYQRQDPYTISRCERELQRLRDDHYQHSHYNDNTNGGGSGMAFLGDANLTRYCTKGCFDEYGVKDLNHRLLQYVQRFNSQQQQKQKQPPSNTNKKKKGQDLKMAIFNDHDIQSCPFSEPNDGRHYHPLNLMRIRLLANMIQCLYPQNDDD